MKKTELAISISDTIEARPDTVKIGCVLTALRPTYSEASKAVINAMAITRAELESADVGVEPKKITFDVTNITKETKRVEKRVKDKKTNTETVDYDYEDKGFRYRTTMIVTLDIHDETKIANVYEILAHSSYTSNLSIRYTLEDSTKYKEELLRKIIREGKAQATLIAEEAGLAVSRIKAMEHGRTTTPSYGFGGGIRKAAMLESCDFSAVANENNAEDIVISDTVNFVFVLTEGAL